MIGNDLVYLKGWSHYSEHRKARFRAKLYTNPEREFLRRSKLQNAEAILWSMKEACYKLNFRHHPVTIFAPKQFECTLFQYEGVRLNGEVLMGSKRFKTVSCLLENYVHTIALPHDDLFDLDQVNILVKPLDQDEKPREIEDARFKAKLRVIKDENGIPHLYEKDEKLPQAISISHDGEMVVFAWL